MPSIIPGYEYDIFISYRQKDNKYYTLIDLQQLPNGTNGCNLFIVKLKHNEFKIDYY